MEIVHFSPPLSECLCKTQHLALWEDLTKKVLPTLIILIA